MKLLIFIRKKKIEKDINYQMKFNIENNIFDLNLIKQNIKNKLNIQTNEINKLITIFNLNENKENKINNFNNFKFENMKHIKTLNNNEGWIYCLKILDDGRLAAGDHYSNLIIYNKETFKPDIIIQNNLNDLLNFTQLKNKNIACSFNSNSTLKIIKKKIKLIILKILILKIYKILQL